MIRIEAPAAIEAPVHLRTRGAEAADVTITVRFRHYGDRELRALARTQATEPQLLAEMILGWDGVADHDDEPVPPTERAIARLLDQLDDGAAKAFITAYKAARDAAARGN